MASMFNPRSLSISSSFYRNIPKALYLRSFISKSSTNYSRSKVSASSLLKNLRSRNAGEDKVFRTLDVEVKEEKSPPESEIKDDFQSDNDLSPEKSREEFAARASESSKVFENLKSSSAEEATNEHDLQLEEGDALRDEGSERTGVPDVSGHVEGLRKSQGKKPESKVSPRISFDLLDSLKKSSEESEQQDGKRLLEKSIEAARNRKMKKFGETMLSSEITSLPKKPKRKWIQKSLEDLEKNQAEPSQRKADPELNKQIKNILSELKVAPKQLGTAKTIVAAAENWGSSSFNLSQRIVREYKEQAEETAFDPSEFSLTEGNRFSLFDNVLNDARAKNLKVFRSESIFLMQSDHLEELQNVNQLGVWQNSFKDEISLSDKLWQYPIDNEVCKEEENGVSFEEHIFLEYLLDDFPKKGPVRRFMELVINGLQKNPHLTVKEKKERVHWFKDYFSDFSEEELNF